MPEAYFVRSRRRKRSVFESFGSSVVRSFGRLVFQSFSRSVVQGFGLSGRPLLRTL